MVKPSAGLLLYRRCGEVIEVFLVHPGGPYWNKKDLGSWSIPKGEFTSGEDPLAAATREFQEETGYEISGQFTPLTPIKQRSGKIVHAWAIEGDCDATSVRSNTFSMEWPPRSGKRQEFPEVDRAEWFTFEVARRKIQEAQIGLLEQLQQFLEDDSAKARDQITVTPRSRPRKDEYDG